MQFPVVKNKIDRYYEITETEVVLNFSSPIKMQKCCREFFAQTPEKIQCSQN